MRHMPRISGQAMMDCFVQVNQTLVRRLITITCYFIGHTVRGNTGLPVRIPRQRMVSDII